MAKLLKLRRGTTSQHGSFTGAEGEVTVDTDKETLVVHDGSTAGGHPVAAEDLANVSSSTIAGRLSNDSLATSKLASGALPTDVTVASANLGTGIVTTAKIADNAITGAKMGNGSVGTGQIVDSSITSAKIADGAIVNADINTSAAIAGSKISPAFGTQDISGSGGTFTGNVVVNGSSGIRIQNSYPRLFLTDTDNDSDYSLINNNGQFLIYDDTDNEFDLKIAGDVGYARFHFVPVSNNTFDLGTSSTRWKNIYTNDLHLSNEGHSNDVDGSWGNWTIQEGESDLFLKNNRSGKKYKFNLTEVS